MAPLNHDELCELDQRIDSLVPSFPLLRTNRRAACRAILTELDALVQSYASDDDLAMRMLKYRGAYNAVDHALRWIFARCPEQSAFVPDDLPSAALELLSFGKEYHYINVQMSLAFRGRNAIESLGRNQFRITSANSENQRLETARHLMAAAEFPDTSADAANLPLEVADSLQKEIRIIKIVGNQLLYSIPMETYQTAFEVMEGRRLYRFSMNPEWDLGGYSFGELGQVWNTLKVLEALHQIALQKLPRQQDRRRLNLKVKSRKAWIDEISMYSHLDASVTRRVFNDLIYNPALHRPGHKKGHVMYQPFIELRTDEIAQSNALVMMTIVEKCSWILTELLRPKIHSKLKNEKERYWIEQEFTRYASDRVALYPHLSFTYESKPGDIDLLLHDTTENFILIAQLKWTTALDNVAGVASDDTQYANGVSQARRALSWAEENRRDLGRRIGISELDIASTTFRPIVIAKESLPSGTFHNSDVPVINEALFRWIMMEPHRATLRQLWELARKADFLPKETIHFERHDPEPLVWGDLEFILEDISYLPGPRRWNPETDITGI
jgi:hypothetical protein